MKTGRDHVRSYDAAMDKALSIVCACIAVPALAMISAVLFFIFKAWRAVIGES